MNEPPTTPQIIDALRSEKPATRDLRKDAANRLETYEMLFGDLAIRISKLTKQVERIISHSERHERERRSK